MGKLIDLTGQRFGRLLVIKEVGRSKSGTVLWLCNCDCGKSKIVGGTSLRQGFTKSCGCLQKERVSQTSTINISNKKFGRLFVLGKGFSKNGRTYWKCFCSCGNENLVFVTSGDLTTGHTKSCGCLRKERCIKTRGINHYRWNPDRKQVTTNKKIYATIKNLLNMTLRATEKNKNGHTEELIGYTRQELVSNLTSKFLPGMSWDNYGKKEGQWSIDHIKPVSAFIREGISDPRIINSLDNLQPLWHIDNLKKHDKWEGNVYVENTG